MNRVAALVSLAVAGSLAGSAHAVIVAGGDGTGNTTAPAGGESIWNSMGILNGSSAVYLGDGYVLTAAHVGAGDVNFGGTLYTMVPGSAVTLNNDFLTNPASSIADLVVFRIDGDPGIAPVSIVSSSPGVGAQVTMIGNGRNRAADITYWSVDSSTNPDTWTVVGTPGEADASGYPYATGNSMRWGTNIVTEGPGYIDVGTRGIVGLVTMFDDIGGDEAQPATNDSGGGVFVNVTGTWQLAGIMIGVDSSVGSFDGQPANTAMYGNRGVFADLSSYQDQIEAIMVPEPGSASLVAVAAAAALRRRRR